jgi:formamidopyrimidine-DNA glycosylase
MPELPDLTVFSENLTKIFKGQKLENVTVFNPKKCDETETFEEKLAGKVLTEVKTLGKEMFFHFGEHGYFGTHLMLKGGTVVTDNLEEVKYKTAAFGFDNGKFLVIYDPQRWAKVLLNMPIDNVPDALLDEIPFEKFKKILKSFGYKPVKAFLIDQSVMKGIGNAYTDEILYACKINPESACNKLPEEVIQLLHQQIPTVLQWGVDEIKKITPDAVSGEGRAFMKVHRKDLSTTATGFTILQKEVASKTTYYTDEQILY